MVQFLKLISVLAAAGLGNTMSDVVGIFFGGYVELLADRMGLPQDRNELTSPGHLAQVSYQCLDIHILFIAQILTGRSGFNVRAGCQKRRTRQEIPIRFS